MPSKTINTKQLEENFGSETVLIQSLKNSLINGKANDVEIIDVREKSNFTNWMIVTTATSSRHGKALSNRIEMEQKRRSNPPIGIEGHLTADWVLLDFFDVIVHIMLKETRSHYDLEKMWRMDFKRSD